MPHPDMLPLALGTSHGLIATMKTMTGNADKRDVACCAVCLRFKVGESGCPITPTITAWYGCLRWPAGPSV